MRRSWLLALAAALALSCPALAQETVKIGLLVPLTGPAAADGLSVLNAVKIAVDRVNAAGGVLGKKVELVYYDDRTDPKEAVAVAYKLIEKDKVVAAVGGSYSMPTRAVAPIFQESRIPLVAAYAVHPDITKAGEYCFRNGFLGTVEGAAAGHVAVEMLKAKRVAILTMDNDFGRTLDEGFRKYVQDKGVEVVYEKLYPLAEKDYKPYLSAIKEAKPDLIFVAGYYAQAGNIVRQSKEIGLNVQILGEEGFDSPKFLEIAGDAAEGVIIVTNLNRDDPRPVVQEFVKEYKARYNIIPDMVGASAYDAFMIIVDAIRRAGTTEPDKVRKAIAETKGFDGLTGVINGFTEIGEVVKPVQVQIVKGGDFKFFGVVDDPAIITPRH